MSLLFPMRFGAITKDTEQPTLGERLQAWIHRGAPVRVAAALGDERTLECAPNVVPMRRPLSRMQTVRSALEDHCKLVGLSPDVAEDAIAKCRYWLGQDLTLSSGELIRKGKVRCSMFHACDPKDCA